MTAVGTDQMPTQEHLAWCIPQCAPTKRKCDVSGKVCDLLPDRFWPTVTRLTLVHPASTDGSLCRPRTAIENELGG